MTKQETQERHEESYQERLMREREEKRDEALSSARGATLDDLIKRRSNRLTLALNVGTDDDPEYAKVIVKGLKRKDYRELLDAHTPDPTDDEPNPDEDTQSFAPALISACLDEPKVTVDDATTIWEEWPREESMTLYAACVNVCVGSRLEVLGKG